MNDDTDYVVTETRRSPAGHVTYFFTDRYGQRMHLTVAYAHSVPSFVDPAIRRMIATHRPAKATT